MNGNDTKQRDPSKRGVPHHGRKAAYNTGPDGPLLNPRTEILEKEIAWWPP
jgi:hypothetical protein